MHAWTSIKHTIAGVSLTLLIVVGSFMTSTLTASARADDPYNPSQDTITCQQASVTVTEGMSKVIPNVLANCKSTNHEQMTLDGAGCIVSAQYPQYKSCGGGAVRTWPNGKVKITMGGARRTQEHDWLMLYQPSDADGGTSGYLIVHVRIYKVPTEKLVKINHVWYIRVHNPNNAKAYPLPLTIHIITHASGHCTWAGPDFPRSLYDIPSGGTHTIPLPKEDQGKSLSHLLFWINSGNAGPEDDQIEVYDSPAYKAARKTC